jgi:hypothetical protein
LPLLLGLRPRWSSNTLGGVISLTHPGEQPNNRVAHFHLRDSALP